MQGHHCPQRPYVPPMCMAIIAIICRGTPRGCPALLCIAPQRAPRWSVRSNASNAGRCKAMRAMWGNARQCLHWHALSRLAGTHKRCPDDHGMHRCPTTNTMIAMMVGAEQCRAMQSNTSNADIGMHCPALPNNERDDRRFRASARHVASQNL